MNSNNNSYNQYHAEWDHNNNNTYQYWSTEFGQQYTTPVSFEPPRNYNEQNGLHLNYQNFPARQTQYGVPNKLPKLDVSETTFSTLVPWTSNITKPCKAIPTTESQRATVNPFGYKFNQEGNIILQRTNTDKTYQKSSEITTPRKARETTPITAESKTMQAKEVWSENEKKSLEKTRSKAVLWDLNRKRYKTIDALDCSEFTFNRLMQDFIREVRSITPAKIGFRAVYERIHVEGICDTKEEKTDRKYNENLKELLLKFPEVKMLNNELPANGRFFCGKTREVTDLGIYYSMLVLQEDLLRQGKGDEKKTAMINYITEQINSPFMNPWKSKNTLVLAQAYKLFQNPIPANKIKTAETQFFTPTTATWENINEEDIKNIRPMKYNTSDMSKEWTLLVGGNSLRILVEPQLIKIVQDLNFAVLCIPEVMMLDITPHIMFFLKHLGPEKTKLLKQIIVQCERGDYPEPEPEQ